MNYNIIIILFVLVLIITLALIEKNKGAKSYEGQKLIKGGAANYLHDTHEPHDCKIGMDAIISAREDLLNNMHTGGAANVANSKVQPWRNFKKWSDLKASSTAYEDFLKEREKLINDPNVDWSDVIDTLKPKLKENREYLFLIDVVHKKANITFLEASSTDANIENDGNTFASVDIALYNRASKIPSLIIGHTHPANAECNPMPSSTDLYLTVTKGADGQYAGEVVFSRYGVIFYGLTNNLYTDLIENNFPQSVEIYSADLIMSHESMRSWGLYSLRECVDFFRKYRLYFYIYPSSEYVVNSDKQINRRILNHPVDLELITFLIDTLNDYEKK